MKRRAGRAPLTPAARSSTRWSVQSDHRDAIVRKIPLASSIPARSSQPRTGSPGPWRKLSTSLHTHATYLRGRLNGQHRPIQDDPLAWFEAERVALVTAVAQASRQGMAELAWDLAGVLRGFLSTRGHLDDWHHTHELALTATERAGNRRGQAYMLRGLGQVHIERDDLEAATAQLEQALA